MKWKAGNGLVEADEHVPNMQQKLLAPCALKQQHCVA